MKPIVAIVGRPNVGKSTLFNRLVGSRKAITLDEAGVSRDRHYATAAWDGREFICIDTGGFPENEKGSLEQKVQEQIDLAIQEADVVVFLLDGAAGLLPEEEEQARRLRQADKRTLFVVNKIDQKSHEDRLADFYRLGKELFPISSEHGYRFSDLLDALVKDIPKESSKPSELRVRVALIGRPNVGKSSILNRLLGEERVVVDATPGTTRDVIDTPLDVGGQLYTLLDTAGIRRGGKWKSEVERYSVLRSLKAIERADLCLLVLDASQALVAQDSHVAGYLMDAKRPVLILWNKLDLVRETRSLKTKLHQIIEEKMPFLTYAPSLHVSAKTGAGMKNLWKVVSQLLTDSRKRFKTSEVNRVFEGLIEGHQPATFRGHSLRFNYATQTSTNPPTFVAFVNYPDGIHFSYRRYLLNGLRKAFPLGGAPIQLLFRKKS